MQGLTALTFLRESYAVQRGDWILVHAAAGGVGLNLCQVSRVLCRTCIWEKTDLYGCFLQIASHLGVNVIGTTSTLEKAELARKNGAETVVVGGDADRLKAEVDKNTDGKGVQGDLMDYLLRTKTGIK